MELGLLEIHGEQDGDNKVTLDLLELETPAECCLMLLFQTLHESKNDK